jgi:zinc and cadmium transporter
MSQTVVPWIFGFAILGSVGAIVGAASFLLFPKPVRERLVPVLVSYATGALLGAALLGLLPDAIQRTGSEPILATVLAGLILFFVLERIVIWRHCHVMGRCEVHKTAGYLILIGDALHNFVDGIVITAAFLSSVPLGISVGVAVLVHEVPQEVGDFAILLDNGFTRKQALGWNLISGAATVPGALAGYIGLLQVSAGMPYILALSAASFLYIGLADLIPGLQGRIGAEPGVTQFLVMLSGVGTIILLRTLHGS